MLPLLNFCVLNRKRRVNPCSFRASTANKKLKQDERTYIRCLWHASCLLVVYGTVRGCISPLKRFMGGGEGSPSLQSSTFPLTLWTRNMNPFRNENYLISPVTRTCEVLLINSQYTLFKLLCFNFYEDGNSYSFTFSEKKSQKTLMSILLG